MSKLLGEMAESKILPKYIHKFSRLRQGVTRYGPAPHKPILLLAVLRGIEEGWIVGNKIELSPELVGAFRATWKNLVTTEHAPLIAQPFFHMRSERFWHHIPNSGYESWVKISRSCQGIGVLNKAVAYVEFDPELFMLAISPVHRSVLRNTLLETYFPDSRPEAINGVNYCDQVVDQILDKSSAEYQEEIRELQDALDLDSFEEEIFVRSGVFKRQIPLVYDNTCCISGLRVETSISASLIDACHIVPFSQSHDDTISNGLSLCPNLHRAFDRGLVAIDPDRFTVLISKHLSEPIESVYSIRQFAGQEIRCPENSQYHPRSENLRQHLLRYADNF